MFPVSQATATEIGQNPEDEKILGLALVVNKIDFTVDVLQRPTSMQKFCWQIIGDLCKQLTHCFALLQTKFKGIATLIAPLHAEYCKQRGCNKELTTSLDLPNDLKNALPQTQAYFEWVRNTQKFLLLWKDKLQKESITYGEILEYTSHYSYLVEIVKVLDCQMYAFDREKLDDLFSDFDLKQRKIGEILIQKSGKHPILW